MRTACEFAWSATRIACWSNWRNTSPATLAPAGGMVIRGETSITSIDIRSGLSSGMAGSAVREDPADSVDELERPEGLGFVLRRAHREPGLLVALAFVRRQHHDRD